MNTRFLATVAALAASLALAPSAGARLGDAYNWQDTAVVPLRAGVQWQREQTWHWQNLAGRARTPTGYGERKTASVAYLRSLVRLWNARRESAYRGYRAYLAQQRRLYGGVPGWAVQDFLCIHRYEGSWTDSGDPYWGGLQMDRGFMATYGSWAEARYGGLANVWPPAAQIAVAYRAYEAGRGFGPWPNTSRYCGLR